MTPIIPISALPDADIQAETENFIKKARPHLGSATLGMVLFSV